MYGAAGDDGGAGVSAAGEGGGSLQHLLLQSLVRIHVLSEGSERKLVDSGLWAGNQPPSWCF